MYVCIWACTTLVIILQFAKRVGPLLIASADTYILPTTDCV